MKIWSLHKFIPFNANIVTHGSCTIAPYIQTLFAHKIDYNNFKSEIITNELLIQEIKQKYANKTTLKLMNKNYFQRILKLYNDSRELNKICKNLNNTLFEY